MTRRFPLLVILLLALTLIACDGASPTEPFGGGTRATLEGHVTYPNGYAAGGQVIALWKDHEFVADTEVNNYGDYKVSGVRPGHYQMLVMRNRTSSDKMMRLEVDLQQGMNKLDFVFD